MTDEAIQCRGGSENENSESKESQVYLIMHQQV